MTDSDITVDSININSFNQQCYEMKGEKETMVEELTHLILQ